MIVLSDNEDTRSYLYSSGHNTGTLRTEGQTDGRTDSQPVAITAVCIVARGHAVKQFPCLRMHLGLFGLPYHRKPLTTALRTSASNCKHLCRPLDIFNIKCDK